MSEIYSFVMGGAFALLISYLSQVHEWRARSRIDKNVSKLMRHLACGKGFVGCDGGPNCKWDHK